MFKLSNKTKLRLLLFGIILVSGLCVSIFFLLLEFDWKYILILPAFLVLYGIVEKCYKKFPNKILNILSYIFNAVFALLYIFFHIGGPFVTICLTFFLLTTFAFGIPALFLLLLKESNILLLEKETIVFISLTLGAILSSNSYNLSKKIIHLFPTIFDRESYKEDLAIYLVHPSNIVFFLYLAYFLYLGITGYFYIEEGRFLISERIDAAILKAFLVYVAFTNMKSKSKDAELNEKDLLKRLLQLLRIDIK